MANKPVYNIADSEYEERRHIFDMWRWINVKLCEMEATPDFDESYHLQKARTSRG